MREPDFDKDAYRRWNLIERVVSCRRNMVDCSPPFEKLGINIAFSNIATLVSLLWPVDTVYSTEPSSES